MIIGTVGLGGRGKTYTTVRRMWALKNHPMKPRRIYSNTPLLDMRVVVKNTPNGPMWCPVDAETFGESWAEGYVTKFEDIYRLDNADVLLDEVGTWMHKSQWNSMPMEVRQFLTQDRREGVNVHWTYRTTRVYHELWDNTAELHKCVRYGPLIVSEVTDPQSPAEKPLRKLCLLTPMTHDLYDTYFRVGDGEGTGYGQGRRSMYGVKGGGNSFVFARDLETVSGEYLQARIRLRPEQVGPVIRKFGPEALGLKREQLTDLPRVRYFLPAYLVRVPGLTD